MYILISKYSGAFKIGSKELRKIIKGLGWRNIEEFLNSYTFDDGEAVYRKMCE